MGYGLKIKSMTPALPDWWAKFTDDDGSIWYSPVAAWALCDVTHRDDAVSALILPVLTSEMGMEPHHPDEGYCEMLYLPGKKFERSRENYCYAWYLVERKTRN
ncbi:hypothetical protein [Klebsiella aerogenes]|uniref:hypothetical protein n=1 Tax=Klebsiella aerogenes TaxID=548 RepID=UPI001F31B1F0|nr:hypothetical protein [Klebsiella aerogenes]